ncbi:hypothetical protein H0H93_012376 [Arthromyces matolae]|nr:hypothetical protein H0H93_012376 [Arthromyces matolae]
MPATLTIDLETGKIIDIVYGYQSIHPDDPLISVQWLDAGEKYVLPGLVDAHVHLNEPGRTDWEGFLTGTKAAISGGVTTVVDMPLNSIPPTTTTEHLNLKRKAAQNQCYSDVAFWGGVIPGNQRDLKPLLAAGVKGFKCFLIESGVEEFPCVSVHDLELAMREIQDTSTVLLFHAELGSTEPPNHDAVTNRLYSTFLDSRPQKLETDAVSLIISLQANHPTLRCHIVHLSASSALPFIRSARKSGLPLTVETCFHYLCISAGDIPDGHPEFKCCPPVREAENQDLLWDGLKEGLIDFVVSDHSPCVAELKKLDEKDIMGAWGGISTLGLGLSLLWTEGQRRGVTIAHIMSWTSLKPAQHAGLAHLKGQLKVGLDGDFIIWNPETEFVVGIIGYPQPTNSTQEAIDGGLNVTDISKLYLRWYPNGYYSQNISYQLAGYGSQGISEGALVHFSEAKVSNSTPPTTTPWIAMVSCDFNATNASQEEDVFTLARDKGAVAALLYSEYSFACVINPEYADPETFDQVFDIFSTQSLTSASLIQYQFGQFGLQNETLYGVYDSQRLNDSASIINTTLQNGSPPAPGYLFAILQAYNSTVHVDDPTTSNGSTSTPPPKKQNTNLAMAIRHPERYGPRTRGRGTAGQSRAHGLTRAILDTFPVVKFGSDPMASPSPSELESQNTSAKYENPHKQPNAPTMELKESEFVRMGDLENLPPKASATIDTVEHIDTSSNDESGPPDIIHCRVSRPTQPQSLGEGSSRKLERMPNEVVPSSIGKETCPICIMDFAEGDDLRVLPCEGKHRFHQACVDPWLLELSSSCPLCREGNLEKIQPTSNKLISTPLLSDFLALENIISGASLESQTDDEEDLGHDVSPRNRFSRYLRFATRRHRQHDSSGQNSRS